MMNDRNAFQKLKDTIIEILVGWLSPAKPQDNRARNRRTTNMSDLRMPDLNKVLLEGRLTRDYVELITWTDAQTACSGRLTPLVAAYFFVPIGNDTYELKASNSVEALIEDWKPEHGTIYIVHGERTGIQP